MTVVTVVWAATTKNQDFIRMQGLKLVVNSHSHRKEFVAGNMSEHMAKGEQGIWSLLADFIHFHSEYREALGRAGDEAGDFYETMRNYRRQERITILSLLQEPFRELPQVSTTTFSDHVSNYSSRLCSLYEPFSILLPSPYLLRP
jgi:hypothetical protein